MGGAIYTYSASRPFPPYLRDILYLLEYISTIQIWRILFWTNLQHSIDELVQNDLCIFLVAQDLVVPEINLLQGGNGKVGAASEGDQKSYLDLDPISLEANTKGFVIVKKDLLNTLHLYLVY